MRTSGYGKDFYPWERKGVREKRCQELCQELCQERVRNLSPAELHATRVTSAAMRAPWSRTATARS